MDGAGKATRKTKKPPDAPTAYDYGYVRLSAYTLKLTEVSPSSFLPKT